MEAIERRAAFLLVAVTIVLAFDRPADFTTVTGTGWQLAIYVLGLLCLAAAAALLVVAIASPGIFELPRDRRERLLFIAFALVATAVVAIALLRAYAVYYVHRHGLGSLVG